MAGPTIQERAPTGRLERLEIHPAEEKILRPFGLRVRRSLPRFGDPEVTSLAGFRRLEVDFATEEGRRRVADRAEGEREQQGD